MNPIIKQDLFKKYYDAIHAQALPPDDHMFPRYKDGDIIDEDKSVRWNREEVERRQKARKHEGERLRNLSIEAWNEFRDLCINFILENSSANNEQAALIYGKTYREAHSGGFEDFYNSISDYIDFFTDLEEAGKDK